MYIPLDNNRHTLFSSLVFLSIFIFSNIKYYFDVFFGVKFCSILFIFIIFRFFVFLLLKNINFELIQLNYSVCHSVEDTMRRVVRSVYFSFRCQDIRRQGSCKCPCGTLASLRATPLDASSRRASALSFSDAEQKRARSVVGERCARPGPGQSVCHVLLSRGQPSAFCFSVFSWGFP